jgi:hypothetical protein
MLGIGLPEKRTFYYLIANSVSPFPPFSIDVYTLEREMLSSQEAAASLLIPDVN